MCPQHSGKVCVGKTDLRPACVSSELCSLTAVASMTAVTAPYRDIQEALKVDTDAVSAKE